MQPHDTTSTNKTCTKCGETKPLAEFSRNKTTRDGLQNHCKACNRAHRIANRKRIAEQRRAFREENPGHNAEKCRTYREDNFERLREYDRERRNTPEDKQQKAEYDRAYRDANRERLRKAKQQYWNDTREERREYQRSYYQANKDAVYQRVRTWVIDNPEGARAQSLRRLARKRNAEGTHTAADIQDQYERQKGRCYYCDAKVNDTYDVDHIIPLSRGGTNWPDNLVISCQSCNRSKQDKLPHEWSEGGRLL